MDKQHDIVPKKVQSTACDPLAVQAQIIHGGQWIVIMYADGTLHLQEPGSDIPSVVDETFRDIVDGIGVNDGINMSLSLSASHETLLSLTVFCSWDAL